MRNHLLGWIATIAILLLLALAPEPVDARDKPHDGACIPGLDSLTSETGHVIHRFIRFTWSGDPAVLTVTNLNPEDIAHIGFCMQGDDGFWPLGQNTGTFHMSLDPLESETVTFGTAVTEFVLYGATLEPIPEPTEPAPSPSPTPREAASSHSSIPLPDTALPAE